MADTNDRASPDRRLRFLRFGLLAITGVSFALVTSVRYVLLGDLSGALVQGVIWGVIVGVVSMIIYRMYKSAVSKA